MTATSLSHSDVAHPTQDPIRSTMSDVLSEFCMLIEEDRLNLTEFREQSFEPSVGRILDALRDGELKGEDKLRRDASIWLIFLRTAMMGLEELGKPEDEVSLNDKAGLRQREQDEKILRVAIVQRGKAAYLQVSHLPLTCVRARADWSSHVLLPQDDFTSLRLR